MGLDSRSRPKRTELKVNLPPGLPQLTPKGWRILLEILIELTNEQGFKFDGKGRPGQPDRSPPEPRDLSS